MTLWISSTSGSPGRDPDVCQHRHQSLTERLKLLLRGPDLADPQVAAHSKGDVVLELFRRKVAGLLETADRLVVLLRRHIGAGVKRTRMLMARSPCSGEPTLSPSPARPRREPGPGEQRADRLAL